MTLGFTAIERPFEAAWIVTLPVTGGEQTITARQPFCGTPGPWQLTHGEDHRDRARPRPRPRTYSSLRAAWIPLAALCLAFFVEMVDNTLLSIALPTIGRDLGGGTTAL